MTTTAPARVKKLINAVEDIVPESLAGLQAAHPDLVTIDTSQNLVLRAGGPRRGKGGPLSGGGARPEAPPHGRPPPDPRAASRRPAARQGRPHLRGWLGPRAPPRRLRRPGHARCGRG